MTTQGRPLDQDSVAALARKHWEEEGKPEGRAMDHWLRAESELREAKNGPARKDQGMERKSEMPERSPKQKNL